MPDQEPRTFTAVEVEDAVIDVVDTIITRGKEVNDTGGLSRLDVSGRVLAVLDASTVTQ